MTANVVNQIAYLRTSRDFPTEDTTQLSTECNKAYLDTALAVNSRTIGIYPVNLPAITGNVYYFTNQKQQTLRQVYTFTTTADIPIGFKISSVFRFAPCFGVYTSTTRTFGLIFGTSVAIAGQISFYLDVDATSTTSDLIKFVVDGGAPPLETGMIILEWITNISTRKSNV